MRVEGRGFHQSALFTIIYASKRYPLWIIIEDTMTTSITQHTNESEYNEILRQAVAIFRLRYLLRA